MCNGALNATSRSRIARIKIAVLTMRFLVAWLQKQAYLRKYKGYVIHIFCDDSSGVVFSQVNEKFHKLERGYRDCIKRTRDKTRIYSIPHDAPGT